MGFFLLIPFFLVRFPLLAARSKDAISRAAHFPPLNGWEKLAYWVYQLSTAGIILCIRISRTRTKPAALFFAGLAVYLAGLFLLAASVIHFAAPAPNGMNRQGLYRFSRNPMYLAYFILFLGCVLLTQSLVLFGLLAVFQTSAHWIILAEERWCREQFGEEYRRYKQQVRRYL